MGISFGIDVEEGIIYAIAEGKIGPEELQAYITNLRADPKFHPALVQVIEFRLAVPNMTDADIKTLVSALPADHAKKLALVFTDGSAKELGLMFKNGATDIDVELFADLGSAIEWVTSD